MSTLQPLKDIGQDKGVLPGQEMGVAPASQSPGHQPSASAAVPASSQSGAPNALPTGFLPLATYPEKRFGYDGLVFCGNGHSIFNAAHHYPSPQAGQIAAFIVRACNSHYELLEAAQAIIARMSGTYKARNGREMGIEADDGERCWIVHSDDIAELERTIAKATGAA